MRIVFATLVISGGVALAILSRAERMEAEGGLSPTSTASVPSQPAYSGQGPATYTVPQASATAPDATPDETPAEEAPRPEKSATVEKIEKFIAAARALLKIATKTGEDGEPLSNEERFNAFVETQRSELPIRVNEQVSLTDLKAADGTISFFYRLEMDGKNINRQSLKAYQPQLEAQYCGDPRLRPMRELGIKATFVLSDMYSRPLYRFFMDPARCA